MQSKQTNQGKTVKAHKAIHNKPQTNNTSKQKEIQTKQSNQKRIANQATQQNQNPKVNKSKYQQSNKITKSQKLNQNIIKLNPQTHKSAKSKANNKPQTK